MISPRYIQAARIICDIVCEVYAITPEQMLSRARPNHIAHPRQVAMVIHRELTRTPSQEVARLFGRGDHGTVLHAEKAISNRKDTEPVFAATFDAIRARCAAAVATINPARMEVAA